VAEAYWGLSNNGLFVYRQFRPMVVNLHNPDARNKTDCSAFVTACYRGGNAPDPNGRAYDGFGYTGTLWPRGVPIASPGPTDLAFYGNMGPRFGYAPSHVAIVVEPGWVISFGHTPISKYRLGYRSDYRGSRHYSVS
jgi:cell wall-associated NlpC family hydrolase